MNKPNRILTKTRWFGERGKFDIDFFDLLRPQRTVCEDPRYISGVYYSDKCKRNIQYESSLELDFIRFLEQSKRVKFYWEQPCAVPYWRGKIKDKYTPDFALYLTTGEIILVEIKDLPGMADHRVQMKVEGLVKFCAEKGFGLLLTNGRQTIDALLKVRCNRKLEKRILERIAENRSILKAECWEILKECGATQPELLKVILKNDLRYRSFSCKIQQVNRNRVFRHLFIEKKPYEELQKNMFPTLFPSANKE